MPQYSNRVARNTAWNNHSFMHACMHMCVDSWLYS